MGRSNAIVVGTLVLAPLILGIEGYAAYRSHHRHRATEVDDTSLAAPLEVRDLPAATPTETIPAAEPPIPHDDAPPPAAVTVEAAADPTIRQQQRALMEHRQQIIHSADEQVFDILNLPDAQRTAIRTIDDQFGRALETGSDLNAEQTRRAAIANLLGPDTISAFRFAERKAERRAQGQFRAQLVRGQ